MLIINFEMYVLGTPLITPIVQQANFSSLFLFLFLDVVEMLVKNTTHKESTMTSDEQLVHKHIEAKDVCILHSPIDPMLLCHRFSTAL